MASEFTLFTSIPPSLDRLRKGREAGAGYQRACVESWRSAGFSVVSVNSATEADAVRSLKVPVHVESVASANRPRIADILALAATSGAKICGIINADCMLLKCAKFVSVLSRHVEASIILSERINIENDTGLPVPGTTGGFDAFFFEPSSVAGVSDPYFRLGDPWWDFWFPIELASRGITVQRLSTPVVSHLSHPKAWTSSSKSFRANENYLLHHVEQLVTEGRAPPGLPQKAQRAGEFWAWLRSRPEREPIRFFGSDLLDFEVLLGNLRESLLGVHNLSEIERLKGELASLKQLNLRQMSKKDLVLDGIDKPIGAEARNKPKSRSDLQNTLIFSPLIIVARALASVSKLRVALVSAGMLLLVGVLAPFVVSHRYIATLGVALSSAVLAVTVYALMSYTKRVERGSDRLLRKMARIRGRKRETQDRLKVKLREARLKLKAVVEDARSERAKLNEARGRLEDLQPIKKLIAHMDRLGIDLVLDVGANEGQYAAQLRSNGFRGDIVSFEPQNAAFKVLQGNCEQDDNWSCHRLAIGEENGQATMNISANSWSSSLLPVFSWTVEAEPSIAYVGQEVVAVRRLDELVPELTNSRRIFLKVDTQGFERRVMGGAQAIADRIAMVQLELAWKPSYEGQTELSEMMRFMSVLGFGPVLIQPGWVGKACIIHEIDVVFARSEED